MVTKEEILQNFDKYLMVKIDRRSIRSIFKAPNALITYNYNLPFQRRYVWNKKEKSPYFIESQLLGYESGTLIGVEDNDGLDIIDGRQRFETNSKFLNNELPLDKNGASILKAFHGFYFKDLPEEIREAFLNSKLRLYNFSFKDESGIPAEDKEYIKRHIFRTYNMYTVPLKNIEIDRAKYFDHELTQSIKNRFLSDEKLYHTFTKLFLSKTYLNKKDIDITERILKKVRELTVINEVPIKYYASKGGKIVDKFYSYICENNPDIDSFYENLLEKIEIVNEFSMHIEKANGKPIIPANEVLFKILDILDKENISKEEYLNPAIITKFSKFVLQNVENIVTDKNYHSKQVLTRYQLCFNYFHKLFDINFNLYLDSSSEVKEKISDIDQKGYSADELINMIETRINKSSPANEPIYSIINDMKYNKFLIRPSYQRMEITDLKIASSVIQSLMLGIPLPPIYFYIKDRIHECVDGQQRLLAILGYLGEYHKNEMGQKEYSKKNGFKLTGLSILKSEEGKTFSELSPEYQKKILSAQLSIVEIDAQIYPEFDKVEQFVRLNSKSYVIKQNTYEMWNAMLSEKVTEKIKLIVKKHASWLYITPSYSDIRMKNEEFFMILAVFDYFYSRGRGKNLLKIYIKNNNVVIKVAKKKSISDFIIESEGDKNKEKAIIKSISNVEKYINKIKILLNYDKKLDDYSLKDELNKLLICKNSKGRTLTVSYLLWHLLNPIPEETINENKKIIKKHIYDIMHMTKNPKNISEEELNKKFNISLKIYEKKFNKNTEVKKHKNYINKITGEQAPEKITIKNPSTKIIKNISLPESNEFKGKNINLNMPVVLNLINNS